MTKLTLSEIKARSTGHFFSKDSMGFYTASNWTGATTRTKYSTKYDKVNDINYVVVVDPWGKKHSHKFDELTGDLKVIS